MTRNTPVPFAGSGFSPSFFNANSAALKTRPGQAGSRDRRIARRRWIACGRAISPKGGQVQPSAKLKSIRALVVANLDLAAAARHVRTESGDEHPSIQGLFRH